MTRQTAGSPVAASSSGLRRVRGAFDANRPSQRLGWLMSSETQVNRPVEGFIRHRADKVPNGLKPMILVPPTRKHDHLQKRANHEI
jgi:hypothetical protein